MIKLLDHGYVRLVSHTKPAGEVDYYWTGDQEVIRNARVSYGNDGEVRTIEQDKKLIDYLYKNRHTSPFEAMVFTFEVKAPIFVFRQWHRHRTWSFNEISARYAELPSEYYVPETLYVQGTGNKQISGEHIVANTKYYTIMMDMQNEAAFHLYNDMIADGVSRELARTVLPVATYSRMFCTVDLHNLFNFCRLRDHDHAQPEIRVYAKAMLELVEPIVPMSVDAYRRFT